LSEDEPEQRENQEPGGSDAGLAYRTGNDLPHGFASVQRHVGIEELFAEEVTKERR
jgi:hypothetical protein